MIQGHHQGQMLWSRSFKVAQALLTGQLLDLQNLDADYLFLILIMLCESISEIVFMIQGHLQGLKLWSF